MANETTLSFGPFMRSVSSVEQHIAPPDAMVGGANMLVDPIAGGAFKRAGIAIKGGDVVTGATNHATNGLLESGPLLGWIPRRLRPFQSLALENGATGGYPTYSVLYGKSDINASFPNTDFGELIGTEYVRRETTGYNYSLLEEFGSSSYPTDGGGGGGAFATSGIYYKVVPFWYESGEGGYSRGAFEHARRFVAAGSWGTVDAGRWRYYPNLRGTPLKWDGGCNDSSSIVANTINVRPTGPFAPLWVPVVTANDGSGTARTAARPWLGGDSFFLSVIYQMEDGSYSQPTYPIFKTLNSGALTTAYASVTYSSIPCGPAGTIARVLLRSLKQTLAAATDATTVDLSDLRVLGVIRNNRSTSYVDTLADDDGLLQDTDIVRWDLICPPRAQHIGTGDQRVIVGKTLPNPCAIELTCTGIAADYETGQNQGLGEGVEGPGLSSACYRVTATALELIVATGGAVAATYTVDWATYTTIKAVVDRINLSAAAGGYGQWKAQIAPGADPFAPSSGLAPTVYSVTNCTVADDVTLSSSTSTTALAAVPIGYKVYAAAGVTAGTYIRLKVDGDTVELSQSATMAAATTVTFYADCGDEACVTTAGSKGWIRVHGSGYPGMVYFKRSAIPGYNRLAADRLYFTISSPGAAATGVSIAANAWGATNRRDGVNNSGQVMGIVDVDGAAVILYRNRIGLFVNERGSNTAEDFDYRIKTINGQHGCISPWSVVSAAGCAVYGTAVGIKATDKSRREILLSEEIYQPQRSLGDLAYEIPQCIAAAARDSYNCWLSGAAWGNRLVYSYRQSSNTYAFSVYDFSPGADQLGLEALADPEKRKPYGWSAPCIMDSDVSAFGPRAMGAVPASDGLRLYGAINDNGGTTDGRVDQLFTGTTDNGATVQGFFSTKKVLAGPNQRFSAQSVVAAHRAPYTGPVIYGIRVETGISDGNRSTSSSGSAEVAYERIQWNQEVRAPGKAAQLTWYDAATSTGGIVFRLDQNVEVLTKAGD